VGVCVFEIATITILLPWLQSGEELLPIAAAEQQFKNTPFKRQDYLNLFKSLSTATASRDLKWGVAGRLLTKTGDKRLAVYQFTSKGGED
jgi:hypothetical protein